MFLQLLFFWWVKWKSPLNTREPKSSKAKGMAKSKLAVVVATRAKSKLLYSFSASSKETAFRAMQSTDKKQGVGGDDEGAKITSTNLILPKIELVALPPPAK